MNHRSIKNEFYGKTRAFVVSALKILHSYLHKGERVPYVRIKKYKIETDGFLSIIRTIYELQPLYDEFIFNHKKELEMLPEYDSCVHAMRSDPTVSQHIDCSVGTWQHHIKITEWGFFSDFLKKQLSKNRERFEFDAELFNCIYNNWEQFFYCDKIELQEFSPLFNFNSDIEKIQLGDCLHIRKIIRSELEQLLDEQPFQRPEVISHLKYAIENRYKAEKVFGEIPKGKPQSYEADTKDRFNKAITALRLFKSGRVWANIIRIKHLSPILTGISGLGLSSRFFWGPPPGYTLTETELREFQHFWNQFNQFDLKQHSSLLIAIRRFNDAYERSRLEDKLIDYMIAFEALFFKEGEMGEFRHKLAVRGARLLKKSYEDRKEIMKCIKEFYDERSKLVHGEKVSLSDEFIDRVENYLRDSIKLFLECLQTSSHNEVISQLDLD